MKFSNIKPKCYPKNEKSNGKKKESCANSLKDVFKLKKKKNLKNKYINTKVRKLFFL